MNDKRNFISIKKAAEFTGLDPQTIRRMFDLSQVEGYKTPSGQRRIDLSSLQKMCYSNISSSEIKNSEKKNFIYARVSTKKQMDDLSRQVDYLRRPEYVNYLLVQDIGSGINFKRKGLQTILDSCIQGNVGEVVIAHRDRLCRFAFELVEYIVTKGGGSIKVLEDEQNISEHSELAEDLLSIIHIFNCRQMGKRSYKKRGKVQDSETPVVSDSIPKTET
jgi:predicted site-specific integrase-resolvase